MKKPTVIAVTRLDVESTKRVFEIARHSDVIVSIRFDDAPKNLTHWISRTFAAGATALEIKA